ncbi:MAG: hypothetical protein R3243_16630, partial [Arenibacter latericius]|nr:hypothetical protein [Arenibacter latericius]
QAYDNRAFEDAWVSDKGVSEITPFTDPLESAKSLVKQAMERPVPIVLKEDDIIVGDWTSKDNSMEWPIKRTHLPKIKEIKFIYSSGTSKVGVKDVNLIADGKSITKSSDVKYLDNQNSVVSFPIELEKGVRANNGASLKVTIDGNKSSKEEKGKVILILEH